MKKITLLTILFFSLFSLLQAQEGPQMVVMECQGKIQYYAPGGKSKPVNVIPGMLIAPEGTLKMKKGASMQVLKGLSVVSVEVAGKAAVQDALPAGRQGSRFGFGADFFSMVSETMNEAAGPPAALTGKKGAGGDDTPPPTSTRKGAGGDDTPPPTSTKKGMGYGMSMLNWNFPVKGKMHVTEPITFSWEGYTKMEGPWLFTIVAEKGEQVTYQAEMQEPYVTLNTVQAKVNIGNAYSWRISPAGRPNQLLKAYRFSLEQEMAEKGILEAVEMEPEYETAGAVQKLLWEAYASEEAGFLVKADKLYKEAIRQQPDNWLAVQLYAAFWGRNW
ncbi:MAG: hypothetical protein WA004_08915 [Saprospiraceae bacterium]